MKAKIRQLINFGKPIKWKYLIIAGLICGSALLNSPVQLAHAGGCDDVRFVFARGSGESLGDKSFQAWQSAISQQLRTSTLHYSFYELGSTSQSGYQYPAVAVSGNFWGYVNLVGAAFSGGAAFAFGESVRQGMGELKNYIKNVSASCPNTQFVLGGYSQGAMILSQSLSDLPTHKITYVATFGDPKLYLPEGSNRDGFWYKVPDACLGKNLSNYRVHVPDCHAFEGVLGSQRPYQTTDYIDKIGTWCNASDIMCSSGMNISDHSAYVAEDLYGDASRKIYQKLYDNFHYAFPNGRNLSLHDVVFMLDGTGSMKDIMPEYRPELKNLAKQVFESGGRVAAYVYRDSIDSDTTIELCDFGCSQTDFERRLGYYIAMDGAEREESLLAGLYHAMSHLDWQWGATKSIIVVTDDWYRKVDFDNITLQTVVEKSLSIDPVNVYVVGPKSIEDYYIELTTQTNGKFFDLAQDVSASTVQILQRPVAQLNATAYSGLVHEKFAFDASSSFGQSNQALTFDWDLDGDGIFERQGAGAKATMTYVRPFNGFIQVRVNEGDRSSTMSAKVQVFDQQIPEKPAEIISLMITQQADNTAKVDFSTDAEYVLLSLDDVVIGFLNIADGAGNFRIDDITTQLAVTLTPYSANQTRGVSRSLSVASPANNDVQDTDLPASSPQPTVPPQPVASSQPSNTPQPSSSSPPSTVLPKVPATGAYDRRLARELKCQ